MASPAPANTPPTPPQRSSGLSHVCARGHQHKPPKETWLVGGLEDHGHLSITRAWGAKIPVGRPSTCAHTEARQRHVADHREAVTTGSVCQLNAELTYRRQNRGGGGGRKVLEGGGGRGEGGMGPKILCAKNGTNRFSQP